LISGTGLGVGSAVGSALLGFAASAEGLALLGWVALSVSAAFGFGALGGGVGNYLTQSLDNGVHNIDWASVYLSSLAIGTLAVLGSFIPQGRALQGLSKGWFIGFCVSGELIIDMVAFVLQGISSDEFSLPKPIFV
jgi:hypothetical protein